MALMVWVYAIVLPTLLTITAKNFLDAGAKQRWVMLVVFVGGAAIGLTIVALTTP